MSEQQPVEVGHGFKWSQGWVRNPLAHVSAGADWLSPTLCGKTLAAATVTGGPSHQGRPLCQSCQRRAKAAQR